MSRRKTSLGRYTRAALRVRRKRNLAKQTKEGLESRRERNRIKANFRLLCKGMKQNKKLRAEKEQWRLEMTHTQPTGQQRTISDVNNELTSESVTCDIKLEPVTILIPKAVDATTEVNGENQSYKFHMIKDESQESSNSNPTALIQNIKKEVE